MFWAQVDYAIIASNTKIDHCIISMSATTQWLNNKSFIAPFKTLFYHPSYFDAMYAKICTRLMIWLFCSANKGKLGEAWE